MYNPKITELINKNLELEHEIAQRIKDYEKTLNQAHLDRAWELQDEIDKNHLTIERLRDESR